MTPFMQFRLWTREGPSTERLLAAAAGLLATALLAWAVLPANGAGGNDSSVAIGAGEVTTTLPVGGGAGAPAGVASPNGTGVPVGPTNIPSAAAAGSASSPGTSSATGGPAAGPSSPAPAAIASSCDNRATDKGVTTNQVLIGVVVYSLGEGNSLLGIPPTADTVKMYNAVFDHYNRQGGIGCRKLVPKFYEEFVLDSSSGHAACLKMQEDGIFALMNNLFTPQNRNCPLQAGIPNFWATSPDIDTIRQFTPYVLSFQADYERLYRDYVFGARQVKWFDGMVKVGILEQTCYPARAKALRDNLAAIGIGPDKISAYNYGCPALTGTQDQNLAAVLQFRRAGVTHVMTSYREAPSPFANAAKQQNFRPKYAFVDDQSSSLMSNANPPYPDTLDGALIIEKSQEGAEYTPGARLSPATKDCTAITKAAGLPGPTDTGTLEGSLHALACIHTKMFVAAAKGAAPLTRRGLIQGLAKVGDLDLSFPAGPADFHNPANGTGGHFWRTSSYHADCTCVKLLDPTWRPEFR